MCDSMASVAEWLRNKLKICNPLFYENMDTIPIRNLNSDITLDKVCNEKRCLRRPKAYNNDNSTQFISPYSQGFSVNCTMP